MPEALRLVLDTNVVLDLVVFHDPATEPLRAAIEARQLCLLTSADCLAELRRVLGYPEFGLDESAQASACDWYASHTETLVPGSPPPFLPRCRDADDQKFLELAWDAQASHLVTKDRALLELARRVAKLGRFSILAPHDLTR